MAGPRNYSICADVLENIQHIPEFRSTPRDPSTSPSGSSCSDPDVGRVAADDEASVGRVVARCIPLAQTPRSLRDVRYQFRGL